MKEFYKVRKIDLSLLDHSSHKPYKSIQCEFGRVIEDGGIFFLETHIFNSEDLANFTYNSLGCPGSANMLSFDGVKIEAPFMVYTRMSTTENKVTFRCYDYITIYEEDVFYTYQYETNEKLQYSQLLRIDFWGLDLIFPSWHAISFIINDAPFDIQFEKDKETKEMYATIPTGQKFVHNTLTEELFRLFRDSLVGYLSLINGARVQITKECYGGYFKLYSYNKIENTSCSYYACGNAKQFNPAPLLFEFDNYVRWNKILDLNKFIYHICSSQQELFCEDSAFILILAFEGLCKKYLDIHKNEIVSTTIIPSDSFKGIKQEFYEIINKHKELSPENCTKFKEAINRLNDARLATFKFYLIIDELNIQRTQEIKNLIKKVRHTLVHEAELKDYSDYVLLSELIREVILRLINSTIKRHSELKGQLIIGEAPNLPFNIYIEKNNLEVSASDIISKYDKRVSLRTGNCEKRG